MQRVSVHVQRVMRTRLLLRECSECRECVA
jgi:hypothetical protein